jgi:hypothetical protein
VIVENSEDYLSPHIMTIVTDIKTAIYTEKPFR